MYFLVFACALCYFSINCIKFVRKLSLLYFSLFSGHLCYHSDGKSQINTRFLHFYTCDIVLITNKKKMAKSPLLPQRGVGGANSLLKHVALYKLIPLRS